MLPCCLPVQLDFAQPLDTLSTLEPTGSMSLGSCFVHHSASCNSNVTLLQLKELSAILWHRIQNPSTLAGTGENALWIYLSHTAFMVLSTPNPRNIHHLTGSIALSQMQQESPFKPKHNYWISWTGWGGKGGHAFYCRMNL